MSGTPIRLLTFTTLYPNAAMPGRAVFVENRQRHLLASGQVTARVVAPVLWFPFRGTRFRSYGAFARVPREETRHGIPILHPRYAVIPKIGTNLAPALLQAGTASLLRRLLRAEPFDLIDAHYLYPEDVAAVWLGRRLGIPVVLTGRGTDITLFTTYPIPRRLILGAVARADGMITVAQGLKDHLVRLGADGGESRSCATGSMATCSGRSTGPRRDSGSDWTVLWSSRSAICCRTRATTSR